MRMFALALVLVAVGFAPEKPAEKSGIDEPAPINNDEELDAVIKQLNQDETFLPALERLIELGRWQIYQVGGVVWGGDSPERRKLVDRAVRVVYRHTDIATAERALNSSRERLQFWALFHLPNEGEDGLAKWEHLVPRVCELATKGSDIVRGEAQERLRDRGDQEEFLSELLETETAFFNIQRLIYAPKKSERDALLMPHVMRLLDHHDSMVQRNVLLEIGFNSHAAAMWQVNFSEAVFKRALELSHSKGAGIRAAAVEALSELRKHDPEATRERVLKLVSDPSDEVRSKVPRALAEKDRPDVQAALETLLRDQSDLVRYSTILALGPEKYIRELQEIAAGSDEKSAKLAKGSLGLIEMQGRSKQQP